MVADAMLRSLIMVESPTVKRSGQAEFEAFYLRTAPLLHGYLCRLSGDPATADDVLQEAYIRLINAPNMEEQVRKACLYRTATTFCMISGANRNVNDNSTKKKICPKLFIKTRACLSTCLPCSTS